MHHHIATLSIVMAPSLSAELILLTRSESKSYFNCLDGNSTGILSTVQHFQFARPT